MQFISTTATAVEKIKSRAKARTLELNLTYTAALEHEAKFAGYASWYHLNQCFAQSSKVVARTATAILPGTVDGVRLEDGNIDIPQSIVTKHHEGLGGPMSPSNKSRTYAKHLESQKRSAVITNLPKGDVFHDVTIEGMRFQGKIMNGYPNIIRMEYLDSNRQRDEDLSEKFINESDSLAERQKRTQIVTNYFLKTMGETVVKLGAVSIRQSQLIQDGREKSWWICKYDSNEPRLAVDQLSNEGRNALAFEFGLPILFDEVSPGRGEDKLWRYFKGGGEPALFYMSPAFKNLCAWVKKYPKRTKMPDQSITYLRDWRQRALAANDSQETSDTPK